jgi:cytochrome c-type biogenesis protein CcmF
MTGSIGEGGLVAAWLFCVFGLVALVWGMVRNDRRFIEAGRRAALAIFAGSTVSVVALQVALLQTDTSVRFVANHSASYSPLWVKMVSMWGALEGSILLWAWLLTLYIVILAFVAKDDVLRPPALAVLYTIGLFFIGVNASVGSPFVPVPNPPLEGNGPNPLLQNHWMFAIHPVLMYLGFVGLSVPFAYALAALITGRIGEAWLSQTRRWTVTAWAFLSAAIIAGGWWSYEVLGWAGYWAWDPVENVSIIPWFLATAYLHSLQIQERRQMLRGWNLGLIIAAFGSTIFGTFVTRSGIIESVHAFASGPIGIVFFWFLVFVLAGSLLVVFLRGRFIRDEHVLDSPISREGAFLLGNLLFVSLAFTVALGTLFPVIVEAIRDQKSTVGPPFFNQITIPIGLVVLLVMAIGPALTWRRISGEQLRHILRWPVMVSVLGAILTILGMLVFAHFRLAPFLTTVVCVLSVAVLITLTTRAARSRAASLGGGFWAALGDLVNTNPRRYGAYLAHFGVVIVCIGIAYSGGYKLEQKLSFTPGQAQTMHGQEVQFIGLLQGEDPEKDSVVAEITVNGYKLYPRMNFYGPEGERSRSNPIATPGVLYFPWGDIYTILQSFDDKDNSAVIQLDISPIVSWIWVGGLVMVLGAGLTLIPAVGSVNVTVKSGLSGSSRPAAGD